MPTIVYTGNAGEATGLNNTPSVSLSGSGSGATEGLLNSVKALLTFSTNAYTNYYNVTATLYYTGGSTSTTRSVKMDSSNYTQGQFEFVFSGLTLEQASNITSVSVSCSNNANKIFLKFTQTVTVDYLPVSGVEAPTKVSVSNESAAPGAKVTLSWSGAKAGENNAILGYVIYRADSADGEYELLTSLSSTATSGSATVTAPTKNESAYYYKVSTIGERINYDSEMSTTYATLTCSFASVGAPTTVTLSATNAAPGAELTLSWSGATAGDNNSIAGYRVYRAESEDGEYSLLTEVALATPVGSATVTAPAENNATYYYKVMTIGTLEGYNSDLSGVYASLTCTFSMPGAPTVVTIDGGTSAYASPGASVTLAWSGASSGANNQIAGYTVYRDGVAYASNLAKTVTSIEVVAHATTGKSYSYTVVTLGTYSDSAPSLAREVYSYTDPTAPTVVNVSNNTPAADSRVTLSWSGATAGGYNDIVGYRVYRATTQTGARSQVTHVSVSTTHASCYVSAPAKAGSSYYFWVETVGSHSPSAMSTAYVSIKAVDKPEGESDGTTVIVPPKRGHKKRGFIFGDYDTAANGWTLTGWEFPEPELRTKFVEVPGRMSGPIDMSTYLTEGEPWYDTRELTAIFECSEGTRSDRIEVISEMANLLHGMRLEIVFPDDDTRYALGRLSVRNDYNDMAHAEVTVVATCEPWRYSQQETRVSLMAVEEERSTVLHNAGRRILIPEVIVSGTGASVSLSCGEHSWTLREGSYKLPDLVLRKGNTFLSYRGFGTVIFQYREAIL